MSKKENENDVRGYVNSLDIDGLTRWYCMIQGSRVLMKKIDESYDFDKITSDKRFFNKIERGLKAYIEERFPSVKSDIIIDAQKLVDTFDMLDDDEV